MSFFYHSSNFEAAAKCGRVVLTCDNAAELEAITEDGLTPQVSTILYVTAETPAGAALTYAYSVAFWHSEEDGRGLFDVYALDWAPETENGEEATAEQVAALEKAAGGLPAVLYGAIEWTAKRCAAAMKDHALTFLSETLEDENAA